MAKNNTFEINGKKVVAKPFDYNLMCDLEDYGASIEDISAKQKSFLRAYIAVCMNISVEEAGQEIANMIISGAKMDGIYEALNKEMENSDFFQALAKNAEKANQ